MDGWNRPPEQGMSSWAVIYLEPVLKVSALAGKYFSKIGASLRFASRYFLCK
jgi:hypothetical protein